MKTKYITILLIACFTYNTNAQSCKELLEICKLMDLKFQQNSNKGILIPFEEIQKKNKYEMMLMDCSREYKQYEAIVAKREAEEEAEELTKEKRLTLLVLERRKIYDILDDNLLAKVCSEVVSLMEDYGYELQKVDYDKNLKDLDKYPSSTPLDKMPKIDLDKNVKLDFQNGVAVKVDFWYNDEEGDGKSILLFTQNQDDEMRAKEIKSLRTLRPLQKFKLASRNSLENDDEKSINRDISFDDVDVRKIIFEATISQVMETKILGKILPFPWANAQVSTFTTKEVVTEYLKKRFTNINLNNSLRSVKIVQTHHFEMSGRSYDYLNHTYYRKNQVQQIHQMDYAVFNWESGKEGKKWSMKVNNKETKGDVGSGKYESTDFNNKVTDFQTPFPDLAAISRLDIFQNEVFVEEFSGYQCFRVDTKWHEILKDCPFETSTQISFFFDMKTFRLIGTRRLSKNQDSMNGYETSNENFKELNGQWLPTKSLQYNLTDLMSRKAKPSILSYDYKFNIVIDDSIFSSDFSKTYPYPKD